MNGLSLEALKGHLFETLEGIRNQNDKEASDCEKVSIEQAKAIVDVADSIIDIYKVQVEAVKMVATMDQMNNPGQLLIGMGVADADDVKKVM